MALQPASSISSTTEMLGLQLLASVGTVRVPDVIAFSEVTEQYPGFLLMEWIEPARRSSRHGNEALLGEQLAMLHKQGASPHYPPAYGLDHNNYIGTTPRD
ncbi:MAG: fructosamine kinase family protein [Blastochloris sp.]|nr:fructosamine kinase family protein [Blastochloris sp.]